MIAAGIAMSYQYYRQKQNNGAVVSEAEIDTFNKQRKESLKAEGKDNVDVAKQ